MGNTSHIEAKFGAMSVKRNHWFSSKIDSSEAIGTGLKSQTKQALEILSVFKLLCY